LVLSPAAGSAGCANQRVALGLPVHVGHPGLTQFAAERGVHGFPPCWMAREFTGFKGLSG
jgi:hypothetical protein